MNERKSPTGSPQEQPPETVYGDVDTSPNNEDQADAHHAEPDEHV
jgi:hypothetical protein